MKPEADLFFECSWEVCNKVGGIYTVVSSKAQSMLDYYKEKFILIGPYKEENISGAFEEEEMPEFLKKACEEIEKEEIHCKFGKWLIPGTPQTILVDFSKFAKKGDEIKGANWKDFGIDSLGTGYFDYDESMIWSTAAGKIIDAISRSNPEMKIVAQFHEWLSGGGVLELKRRNSSVKTVFTTHATMLGRSIAGAGVDLYGMLGKFNPEEEARRYGIISKFHTERACAQKCDVFTTVSEITGIEAEHLLGRKPDVLLPNGLDIEKFPTFEEASINHRLYKNKFYDFISSFFFPYEEFDVTNTLIFFLAGRYEMHVKGIDVYIDALSQLNSEMKKEETSKTIIAFIWVPAGTKGIRNDVLMNKANYEDIHESIEDQKEEIIHRIIQNEIKGKTVTEEVVFQPEQALSIKTMVKRFKKTGMPPVCTHVLEHEKDDAMLQKIRQAGLLNRPEDRVKMVLFPVYLTGADGLLDTNYYESIQAGHLGVFPSYYEPWGYTPLESGALGVPSVTTDLSGFGRYVKEKSADQNPGVYVIPRKDVQYQDTVKELTKVFLDFTHMTKQERIENKIKARSLANFADWKFLGENYIKAHNMAVGK